MAALPAYRPELDSFRAYAVLLVLLSHWLPAWFVAPYNWGIAGVQLFFVISGYVITRILLTDLDRESRWQNVVGKFYLRRILRIWPIYYLTCIVVFFIWPRIDSQYAAWHFLFASNSLAGHLGRQPYPAHFWSLSVEQQFYLAWPLLAFFLTRRRLALLCVACVIASPLFRFLFLTHYQNLPLMLTSTLSNMDTIAAGALLALVERKQTPAIKPAAIDRACDLSGLVGAILLSSMIYQRLEGSPEFGFVGGASAIALMSLWLIRRAPDYSLIRQVLNNPVTIFIGTISYGIYVYHLFVGTALMSLWPDFTGSRFFVVAATLLTIGIATASWYLIEKPFLRLKTRLH